MAKRIEDVPCAVIIKEQPKDRWRLLHFTMVATVAWKSAKLIQRQELSLFNNPHSEVRVVTQEDYDEGKFTPYNAPAGFDFELDTEPTPVAIVKTPAPPVKKPVVAVALPPAPPPPPPTPPPPQTPTVSAATKQNFLDFLAE